MQCYIQKRSKSISRVLYRTVIYLRIALLHCFSHQIGSTPSRLYTSCEVLLQVGFTQGSSRQSPSTLLPHFSTLTPPRRSVSFLLHYPWSRLHRVLPGTIALWSPDFPHTQPFGLCMQPSDLLLIIIPCTVDFVNLAIFINS